MTTRTFGMTFKTQTVSATTKQEVMRKLRNNMWTSIGWSSDSKTNGLVLSTTKNGVRVYRLFVLTKYNKKSSQVQKVPNKGKNKGINTSTMTVLRKPHWVATYIDVPDTVVKSATQHERHFDLVLGI